MWSRSQALPFLVVGDIILIELNSNNLNSLELAIDYIQGKGYEFSYLDELLNEEI